MALTASNGQELIALDELASAFQLAVREERGAVTVAYKGRTIVLTPDQTIASVAGRLISLSVPPQHSGTRWLVPLDFITRALTPIYDQRLDLRRPSHLLIVGDLRVPRVVVRHEPLGNSARVTVDVTPATSIAVTQQGPRLLIRVDGDALDATLPAFQSIGFVQAIRLADATNIALDLGPRFASFRSATSTIDGGSRVTVEVVGNEAPAPPAGPAAPAPAVTDQQPLPSPGGAAGLRTVAIDAGHGGDDAGARGPAGTAEKDVTLNVARRLRGLLEARLGVRVVMTRDDDRTLPVETRSATANNNKADLLVSLHANTSFRPEVSGATVYVAAFSDADLAVEGLAPERLPVFGGGLRTIEVVPWNLAQIPHRAESERVAQVVVEAMRGRVPLAARAVEHAPLRLLESANMPAVLVEMGYLTNAEQESALAGADLPAAVAQALFDAIVRVRDTVSASAEGTGR